MGNGDDNGNNNDDNNDDDDGNDDDNGDDGYDHNRDETLGGRTQETTDFWHAADSLSLLTESLYEAWVLQPERRRDAESMKEAGLGVGGGGGATASALTYSGSPREPEVPTAVEVGGGEGRADRSHAKASAENVCSWKASSIRKPTPVARKGLVFCFSLALSTFGLLLFRFCG